MDRRYQVFVSSTYEDLQEERAEAIQALLELDCMPAGMELFPAANEQQWAWIRKIIDESDYYITIVGGRYGSVHPEKNISYTEMEYRYAIEADKPVLTFLHEDPGSIASGKCEVTQEGRERLSAFRELCEKRLCKYWSSPSDLAAKISRSFTQLIKREPRAGWIRADTIDSGQQLETLSLREENRRLTERLKALSRIDVDEGSLSSGADPFEIDFHFEIEQRKTNKAGSKYWVRGFDKWKRVSVSWDQVFYSIIPVLSTTKREQRIYGALNETIGGMITEEELELSEEHRIKSIRVSKECAHQIRMQFMALGYIEVEQEQDSHNLLWLPTEKGASKIAGLGALKKGERCARHLFDIE